MTAAAITHALAASGIERQGHDAVYTVVMDDHNVHCMTEPMLDEWFRSLHPEEKAEVYKRDLDRDLDDAQLIRVYGTRDLGKRELLCMADLEEALRLRRVLERDSEWFVELEASAASGTEPGVLLVGQPKLDAAAVVPQLGDEAVPVAPAPEGVPAFGHLDHAGGIVEGAREQHVSALAQGHAPSPEDHLETHRNAMRKLQRGASGQLPGFGSSHVPHGSEDKANISGNPVEVLRG